MFATLHFRLTNRLRGADDSPEWRALDFRFHILGSSSSGNCALLVTPNARVLIDAGFSGKRIDAALRTVGESLDRIDAVFFTHEHHDHACGLPAIAKRAGIRLYANRATARDLQSALTCNANWHHFENGEDFSFRDIRIHAFAVPHDAADPVAFRFTVHEGTLFERRLAWVTDLGHVPELVRRHAADVDCLILESNYDPDLLDLSERPLSLKQRIRGRHGHLSNHEAMALLASLDNPRLTRVFLGHLSKECNRVELVQAALAPVAAIRPHCRYTVIDPAGTTPIGVDWDE